MLTSYLCKLQHIFRQFFLWIHNYLHVKNKQLPPAEHPVLHPPQMSYVDDNNIPDIWHMYAPDEQKDDLPIPYDTHDYNLYNVVKKKYTIHDITPNDERVVYKLYDNKHFIFFKNFSFETILDQYERENIITAAIALQKVFMPSCDLPHDMVLLLVYYIYNHFNFDWNESVEYPVFMEGFFNYCTHKLLCYAGPIFFDDNSIKNNMADAITFLQYKTLNNRIYGLKPKPKEDIKNDIEPTWKIVLKLNKLLQNKHDLRLEERLFDTDSRPCAYK